MTRVQRFFKRILPKQMAAEMEAESREWMLRCECGTEQSIWELGGIRWKASGNPKKLMKCAKCGKATWHTLTRQSP